MELFFLSVLIAIAWYLRLDSIYGVFIIKCLIKNNSKRELVIQQRNRSSIQMTTTVRQTLNLPRSRKGRQCANQVKAISIKECVASSAWSIQQLKRTWRTTLRRNTHKHSKTTIKSPPSSGFTKSHTLAHPAMSSTLRKCRAKMNQTLPENLSSNQKPMRRSKKTETKMPLHALIRKSLMIVLRGSLKTIWRASGFSQNYHPNLTSMEQQLSSNQLSHRKFWVVYATSLQLVLTGSISSLMKMPAIYSLPPLCLAEAL